MELVCFCDSKIYTFRLNIQLWQDIRKIKFTNFRNIHLVYVSCLYNSVVFIDSVCIIMHSSSCIISQYINNQMDFKIQQHCSSFFIGNRPGQDEAMAGPTGYQQTAESEYRVITWQLKHAMYLQNYIEEVCLQPLAGLSNRSIKKYDRYIVDMYIWLV